MKLQNICVALTTSSVRQFALAVISLLLINIGFAQTALRADVEPGSVAGALEQTKITIDVADRGRVFDGVGMISGGGGNTRLLYDYIEPYRSQILNYLFKPNYGASLQILKIEIGADVDSTDGAEASHMHTRDEENYYRGYEWWLMEEAKQRQPEIILSALPWSAPGWVGGGKDYFSQDLIDYMIKWLLHAKSDHHLSINSVGGRNENGYDVAWYKKLKTALQSNGLSTVHVIASDDWWEKGRLWAIASDIQKDPALDAAIDIIGGHTPHLAGYPTDEDLSLRQPFWSSEDHFDQQPGWKEMARSLNRNYIGGKITATLYWPMVSAIYDNLPFREVGLIKCNQPWSGDYHLTPSVWVMAHTTQFVKPGWHYLDSACGYFSADKSGNHSSYVALAAPDNRDFSLIIETVDAIESYNAGFYLKGPSSKTLHVWATNLNSRNPDDWFVRQPDIVPKDGHFSVLFEPGYLYSITTTDGQKKGDASPPKTPAPLQLPYADDFDRSPPQPGRYFSDIYGSFEIAPCAGGRPGFCLRQTTPQPPYPWNTTGYRPFTMMGNLDWGNYRVSCDVLLEKPGAVDLLARLSGMSAKDTPNAYVLRVTDTGVWSLIKSTVKDEEIVLNSGVVKPFGINTWHHIGLVCTGSSITAEIEGETVATVADESHAKGMVGLGTNNYLQAEFGRFRVDQVP